MENARRWQCLQLGGWWKEKNPFTSFHGSVLTSWRAAFKNFASAGLNSVCLMAGNMGISSSPQTRAGQTSCDQRATSSQQGPFCVRINSPTGGTTWELQCRKAGGYKLGVRLNKLSLRFPEGCICPSWRAELQGLSGYGQRGLAIDLESRSGYRPGGDVDLFSGLLMRAFQKRVEVDIPSGFIARYIVTNCPRNFRVQ